MKLSRNAPCPCNSGKKYKKCCIGKISKSHESYYGFLHKEGIIKERLVGWAFQNFSQDELDEYVYEFNKKNFEELKDNEDITNFFDWFFLEALHKEEGKRMLKVIIGDFSDLFDSEELKIMNEWANNTQSGIFEVEGINKDDWKVSLREIFTDKKYEIMDKKASAYVIRGDIMFGRVQKIFSGYYLSGAITGYPRVTLLDQLKDFVNHHYNIEKEKNPGITYEQFMNSNSRVLNDFTPKEPKFLTSKGEEAKVCEAVYSVDINHIEEILDWFDEDKDFLITDEDYERNKFKSASICCLKKGNGEMTGGQEGFRLINHYIDEDGNKIETEGSIEIKGNSLEIFSTSERVFKKVVNKLEKNIGRHIELKKEEIKTTDDALKERDKIPKKEKKDIGLIKLEKRMMEQYYKDWCDKKIPALNNKTPREAIKTSEGKKLLNNLLLDVENQEQHKKREQGKYIPAEKIIREELNFYE